MFFCHLKTMQNWGKENKFILKTCTQKKKQCFFLSFLCYFKRLNKSTFCLRQFILGFNCGLAKTIFVVCSFQVHIATYSLSLSFLSLLTQSMCCHVDGHSSEWEAGRLINLKLCRPAPTRFHFRRVTTNIISAFNNGKVSQER